MRTADFDFDLPRARIAQEPAPERDGARLLVLHRSTGRLAHETFRQLPSHLQNGDLLVLNDSRVIPARLHGVNLQTDGALEILLLEETRPNEWWALLRPGKRCRPGMRLTLCDATGRRTQVQAEAVARNDSPQWLLRFTGTADLAAELPVLGHVPLPPYIKRPGATDLPADRDRYQTVYATKPGSVAAPTAGLHFTPSLLEAIRARGVEICFVTLHVGLGTFAPVRVADLAAHVMHAERFEVSPSAATAIATAKARGRRVVAVGTTVVRVLESVAAENQGRVIPARGRTRMFLHPPCPFRIVDALVTNFHLPRSTLLMLVSAFAAPGRTCGRELILGAYAEAVRQGYRFFSYGDAMLIL